MAGRVMHEAAPLGGAAPADPIGSILRAFEDRYNRDPNSFMRNPDMADQMPAFDAENAPAESFIDPQSAIASILGQMQGAADRSKVPPYDPFNAAEHQGLETVQNANRPMPTNRMTIEDLIAQLLSQR